MTATGAHAPSLSAISDSPETSVTNGNSPKKPGRATPAMAKPENQVSVPTNTSPPIVSTQRSRSHLTASPGNAGEVIGDYALGETIGKGTFGKVKLGLHLITGEKVAVKILEKKRIVEVADVERVAREIKILKRNRHVNVIQLFEVIDSPERIFLIMEYVDSGEMFEYIVAHHRIREPDAVVLFRQIVDGLDYLHANEVTHRDLKPENLLLQSCASMPTGFLVKIVDFGLSNTHDGGRLLRTACGSPCYAAPEMIQGKLYKGPVADIWSLGVVLFAMVCGFLPFEDSNTNMLYKKILSADYKLPPFLSHAVQDLIRRIFETNPEKRYTTEMIRQHPWFTSSRVVPRSVVASPEDTRVKNHILHHLATLGLDPTTVQEALVQKIHNNLTAAYFLMYNKLVRLMKEQPSQPQQPAPRAAVQLPPQPKPPSVSEKSDGTPRRPEIAPSEEVRSTGIRTSKEPVPIKAPSSAAAISPTTPLSLAAEATGAQRRRASDMSGTSTQVTRTPSQVASPRSQNPLGSASRRPSSVRSGRNLVLLTNGTHTTPTAAAPPQRPQIPAAIMSSTMARLPSQGSSQPTRVSVSNGMVALTPLLPSQRKSAPLTDRRQTVIDVKTSASYVAPSLATTLAHRRVTAVAATTLVPVNGKEDDVRLAAPQHEQPRRIPPQRPAHPAPSGPHQQFTQVL